MSVLEIEPLIQYNGKPKTFCINLDRKPENWIQIKKIWSSNLNLERISAIDGIREGISAKEALRNTTKRFYKLMVNCSDHYVILIEDDVYKTKHFNRYWPSLLRFLNLQLDTWDIISLDPRIGNIKIDNTTTLHVFNSLLYTISGFVSAGFIIYRTGFIKDNINYLLDLKKPVDGSLTWNAKFTKLTPKHLLVKQYTNKISTIVDKVRPRMYLQMENIIYLLKMLLIKKIGFISTHISTTPMNTIHTNILSNIIHYNFLNKNYLDDENYILWICNPIARYVIVFNTYSSLIPTFTTPNSLAEALSSSDLEVKESAENILNTDPNTHHIFKGIGWYLNNGKFVTNRNNRIIFVGKVETFKKDSIRLGTILGKQFNRELKIETIASFPKPMTYMSPLAIQNIVEWYKDTDYAALTQLQLHGWISKKIVQSYYKYKSISNTINT